LGKLRKITGDIFWKRGGGKDLYWKRGSGHLLV